MFLADTYLIQNKIYFFTVAAVVKLPTRTGGFPHLVQKKCRMPLLAAQLIVV
ncbi:hypothetical protein SAMN03159300_108170 [Janthinobacterium sp. 344]|nr:hypothetical protein SAMN03159349_03947 [Janthinobacterium sp. 551a]SFB58675.1 hypothetical protein SAMN03159300_108170 [Janthinobacterium sp. 344]